MVIDVGEFDSAHRWHIECSGGIVSHAEVVLEQGHHAIECAFVASAAYVEASIARSEAKTVFSEALGAALTYHHVALSRLTAHYGQFGSAYALHKILQQLGSLLIYAIIDICHYSGCWFTTFHYRLLGLSPRRSKAQCQHNK